MKLPDETILEIVREVLRVYEEPDDVPVAPDSTIARLRQWYEEASQPQQKENKNMPYKDVFGNDVDGNGKPLGEPLSTKPTPEERAARELEEEFHNETGDVAKAAQTGTRVPIRWTYTEGYIHWLESLALRQRVKLNES